VDHPRKLRRRLSQTPRPRPENTADMVSKGRGTARRLSDEQVAEIVRRKAAGETQTAIAADLGVSQALVSLELKRSRP
jgi:hypothetical protein